MAETISFSCSFYGAHLLCDTGSHYIIGERKLEKKLPEKSWFQGGNGERDAIIMKREFHF